MSDFASVSSTPPVTLQSSSRLPALLVVDKQGIVIQVSESAGSFWQRESSKLLGLPIVSFFDLELFSEHPSSIDVQWVLLLTTARNRKTICSIRLPDALPFEVTVVLEECRGSLSGYFVWVAEVVKSREAPAAPVAAPMLVDSGLALLADQGAVGFFDLNFKGGQVYYSPAWKRLLGYNETEIVNTYDSWLRLIHPDDSAAAPDHVARNQINEVRSFSVEIRMLHRSGHYVWVQCIGTQVFGRSGELERVTGLQIDISERKELEEQTMVNEDRFYRLATDGSLAAFDLDFTRHQFWFSPVWCKLFGTLESGGLSSLAPIFPSALTLDEVKAFFLAPSPEESSFAQAVSLTTADGRSVPVLLSGNRQLSRKRELNRVVGFCCPLPDNLSAVTKSPIPAALLDETLAALSEAVIVANEQGVITYLNANASRLTGYDLESARRLKINEVFRLVYRHNGKPADHAVDLALATATDKPVLLSEHSLTSADGGLARQIVWSIRQICEPNGKGIGTVLVFRDPHEMSLTPEELLKANRLESLGVIAGGIAHDFNNLLTTILGGISQAKDNRDSSYLVDSERACLAAKALTKQLLAAAKGSESGALQTLSVVEMLRDAMRLARAGAAADVKLSSPDIVSPVSVDRPQMLQVFQNLIINAIQAVPAHGGKIWLYATDTVLVEDQIPQLPAGDYVEIEVKDNGSGIAPEHLEKIFEPFFTTKKNGTGIGLPTVLSIVRKHGGHVRVSSVVGEGTTFSVLLPKANQPVEAAEARRAPALRFGTGRVLFMDDDADICRLTSGMLASLDYKYDVARNGEEALVLYRRYLNVGRPYDLVILDLTVIGGMGGEETFRELRELDPNVRAIVCSGYDSEEMAQHYAEMGLCGYLAKPFRVADLGKILKTVLD